MVEVICGWLKNNYWVGCFDRLFKKGENYGLFVFVFGVCIFIHYRSMEMKGEKMAKNKKYKLYIYFNNHKCYWFEFEDKQSLDDEFKKFRTIKGDSVIFFGDTIVNFSNVAYMEKVEE